MPPSLSHISFHSIPILSYKLKPPSPALTLSHISTIYTHTHILSFLLIVGYYTRHLTNICMELMELQLGLALPTNPSKFLDLNSRSYDPFNYKKRTFSQLLVHAAESTHTDVMLPTLSLLPLTPNHDGQDHHSQCSNITKDDEECVVGWPPVNYWRKKLCVDNCGDEVVGNNDHMVWVDHHHGHHHSASASASASAGIGGSSNTHYVKVKMEGVGIARKVDLSTHQSFQTLKETLMDMFGKCHQQSNSYELAYQDKEGDWLLAQDVPWRSFVGCAQRLKLVKSSR